MTPLIGADYSSADSRSRKAKSEATNFIAQIQATIASLSAPRRYKTQIRECDQSARQHTIPRTYATTKATSVYKTPISQHKRGTQDDYYCVCVIAHPKYIACDLPICFSSYCATGTHF